MIPNAYVRPVNRVRPPSGVALPALFAAQEPLPGVDSAATSSHKARSWHRPARTAEKRLAADFARREAGSVGRRGDLAQRTGECAPRLGATIRAASPSTSRFGCVSAAMTRAGRPRAPRPSPGLGFRFRSAWRTRRSSRRDPAAARGRRFRESAVRWSTPQARAYAFPSPRDAVRRRRSHSISDGSSMRASAAKSSSTFFSFAKRETKKNETIALAGTPKRRRKRSSRCPGAETVRRRSLEGTTSTRPSTPAREMRARHPGSGRPPRPPGWQNVRVSWRRCKTRRVGLERKVVRVCFELRVIRVNDRHTVAPSVSQPSPAGDEERMHVDQTESLDHVVDVAPPDERQGETIRGRRRQR